MCAHTAGGVNLGTTLLTSNSLDCPVCVLRQRACWHRAFQRRGIHYQRDIRLRGRFHGISATTTETAPAHANAAHSKVLNPLLLPLPSHVRTLILAHNPSSPDASPELLAGLAGNAEVAIHAQVRAGRTPSLGPSANASSPTGRLYTGQQEARLDVKVQVEKSSSCASR